MLAGMSLMACQNDDSKDTEPAAEHVSALGLFMDGAQITSVHLYFLDSSRTVGELSEEYWKRTKTVKDYSAFNDFEYGCLYMMVDIEGAEYCWPDDWEERVLIKNLEHEYYKEKSSFILEDFKKYWDSGKKQEWPAFFTACTNGDVSITCDKKLFGKMPGTNLSRHFTIATRYPTDCLPVGIENPSLLYTFGDEIPSVMDQYFVKGVWLQNEYFLGLKDLPTEKYDNLTLRLSIPMVIEHSRDYVVAKYKGLEFPDRFTEKVFTAECRINFDWD